MDTKTNIFVFIVIGIFALRALAFRWIENPNTKEQIRSYIADYRKRCKKGYAIFKQNIKDAVEAKKKDKTSDEDKKV